MPAFNFQNRFAPLILSGTKRSTIRSREAKVGTMAYLFTGMRTKACKRLGQSLIIACTPIVIGYKDNGEARIKLASHQLTVKEAASLAITDGFDSAREMVKWFETTYKVPANHSGCGHDVFSGFLIDWVGL
jgi:hypothetical protein